LGDFESNQEHAFGEKKIPLNYTSIAHKIHWSGKISDNKRLKYINDNQKMRERERKWVCTILFSMYIGLNKYNKLYAIKK
jgi:N-acetylmuramic acid 6-phosphate (MurNAc-6-P) etherase